MIENKVDRYIFSLRGNSYNGGAEIGLRPCPRIQNANGSVYCTARFAKVSRSISAYY